MTFLLRLFSLALRRKRSKDDYFEFQQYQARHVVARAKEILNLCPDASVIDYGCGKAGYSFVLGTEFRRVLAVDYYVDPVRERFEGMDTVRFEEGDLLTFRGEQMDFLFCASVIEHIPPDKRERFLLNAKENIKPGGSLYLSFPPFRSIIGGHLCAPFHYLPDPLAFYLTRTVKGCVVESYETMFGSWGLYRTSIRDIEALLLRNGFEIVQIRSRYMPDWYSRLFRRNDILNWHAEFYCRRGTLEIPTT